MEPISFPPITFELVADMLDEQHMIVTPAELQGMLCGLVCGGLGRKSQKKDGLLSDLLHDGEPLPEVISTLSQQLTQYLYVTLSRQEDIVLLLPSDQVPLGVRLDSLSEWTQSFLAGFSATMPNLEDASVTIHELLDDLVQIAQVSAKSDEDDEISVESYEVLFEHVVLSTHLFFKEFSMMQNKLSDSKTLH